MRDFFDRVVARALGRDVLLRPRGRSLFEVDEPFEEGGGDAEAPLEGRIDTSGVRLARRAVPRGSNEGGRPAGETRTASVSDRRSSTDTRPPPTSTARRRLAASVSRPRLQTTPPAVDEVAAIHRSVAEASDQEVGGPGAQTSRAAEAQDDLLHAANEAHIASHARASQESGRPPSMQVMRESEPSHVPPNERALPTSSIDARVAAHEERVPSIGSPAAKFGVPSALAHDGALQTVVEGSIASREDIAEVSVASDASAYRGRSLGGTTANPRSNESSTASASSESRDRAAPSNVAATSLERSMPERAERFIPSILVPVIDPDVAWSAMTKGARAAAVGARSVSSAREVVFRRPRALEAKSHDATHDGQRPEAANEVLIPSTVAETPSENTTSAAHARAMGAREQRSSTLGTRERPAPSPRDVVARSPQHAQEEEGAPPARDESPTLRISIGRLDVRCAPSPAPVAPRPAVAPAIPSRPVARNTPRISLDEYLAQRDRSRS